jgi:hypothetical protein
MVDWKASGIVIAGGPRSADDMWAYRRSAGPNRSPSAVSGASIYGNPFHSRYRKDVQGTVESPNSVLPTIRSRPQAHIRG